MEPLLIRIAAAASDHRAPPGGRSAPRVGIAGLAVQRSAPLMTRCAAGGRACSRGRCIPDREPAQAVWWSSSGRRCSTKPESIDALCNVLDLGEPLRPCLHLRGQCEVSGRKTASPGVARGFSVTSRCTSGPPSPQIRAYGNDGRPLRCQCALAGGLHCARSSPIALRPRCDAGAIGICHSSNPSRTFAAKRGRSREAHVRAPWT
jgi:hypothetical protein